MSSLTTTRNEGEVRRDSTAIRMGLETEEKKTNLHLNIQNADASLRGHVLDGSNARAIVVTREHCVLDERGLIDQVPKLVLADEVIFTSILFARSRGSCRI